MNERQQEYFRRKLIAWRESILAESQDTLAALQNESENHPDIADRASSETDRAIELRARDRQRKLIAKIEAALARIDDGSLRLLHRDGRADLAAPARRAADRHAFGRGAGAPRAAREDLPRRLEGADGRARLRSAVSVPLSRPSSCAISASSDFEPGERIFVARRAASRTSGGRESGRAGGGVGRRARRGRRRASARPGFGLRARRRPDSAPGAERDVRSRRRRRGLRERAAGCGLRRRSRRRGIGFAGAGGPTGVGLRGRLGRRPTALLRRPRARPDSVSATAARPVATAAQPRPADGRGGPASPAAGACGRPAAGWAARRTGAQIGRDAAGRVRAAGRDGVRLGQPFGDRRRRGWTMRAAGGAARQGAGCRGSRLRVRRRAGRERPEPPRRDYRRRRSRATARRRRGRRGGGAARRGQRANRDRPRRGRRRPAGRGRRAGGAGPDPRDARFPRRRQRAVDLRFEQDVVRAADHDQVLDIVPPDQNELPLSVEAEGVDQTRAGAAASGLRAPANDGRRRRDRRSPAPPERRFRKPPGRRFAQRLSPIQRSLNHCMPIQRARRRARNQTPVSGAPRPPPTVTPERVRSKYGPRRASDLAEPAQRPLAAPDEPARIITKRDPVENCGLCAISARSGLARAETCGGTRASRDPWRSSRRAR